MSQSPTPKGNLMQTMLLALVLFLGFQALFGNRQPDTRSSTEILSKMREYHEQIRDQSIAAELPKYEAKIREEASSKGWKQDEVDTRIMEGVVLVAETQYRAATQRDAINRATNAFMTLHGKSRQFEFKPIWEKPVQVASHPQFPETTTTPKDLYAKVINDLDERNQKDLVFGLARGYAIIDVLVSVTGKVPGFSYAFAALLLAIVVRAIIWPLAQKQLMFSRQMQQLVPLVNELKEKYKGNPAELNVKTMELYRSYGINPMAGCFPALLQLPLFLFVYQCMLHYRFEFRNGTFLWINPSVAAETGGWTAPNLGEMDYPLIVVYGVSMVISTMLSPISDPSNARQQRLIGLGMSLFITVMMFFWPLPSAFVLYWIFTNVLSTIQSLRAYRLPIEPLVKKFGPNGTAIPTAPVAGTTNGKTNGQFKSTGAPKIQKPKKKR